MGKLPSSPGEQDVELPVSSRSSQKGSRTPGSDARWEAGCHHLLASCGAPRCLLRERDEPNSTSLEADALPKGEHASGTVSAVWHGPSGDLEDLGVFCGGPGTGSCSAHGHFEGHRVFLNHV